MIAAPRSARVLVQHWKPKAVSALSLANRDLEWIVMMPVGAVMLGLGGVVYVSARPWVKVDPMEALRHA